MQFFELKRRSTGGHIHYFIPPVPSVRDKMCLLVSRGIEMRFCVVVCNIAVLKSDTNLNFSSIISLD